MLPYRYILTNGSFPCRRSYEMGHLGANIGDDQELLKTARPVYDAHLVRPARSRFQNRTNVRSNGRQAGLIAMRTIA